MTERVEGEGKANRSVCAPGKRAQGILTKPAFHLETTQPEITGRSLFSGNISAGPRVLFALTHLLADMHIATWRLRTHVDTKSR